MPAAPPPAELPRPTDIPARPLTVIDAGTRVVRLHDNGRAAALAIEHASITSGVLPEWLQAMTRDFSPRRLGRMISNSRAVYASLANVVASRLSSSLGGQQVDEGAAAGNPEDAIETALFSDCVGDKIMCVHCYSSFRYGGRIRQRLLRVFSSSVLTSPREWELRASRQNTSRRRPCCAGPLLRDHRNTFHR